MAESSASRSPSPLIRATSPTSPPHTPRSPRPIASYTITELTATIPTQLNSPPLPSITEPSLPPDHLPLVAALRASIASALEREGGPRLSPTFPTSLPTNHWRDTYTAHRSLTSIPISPDPRLHPACTPHLLSPSLTPSTWSDALLHRFLTAQRLSVPHATTMFTDYLAFRHSYGVDDLARQHPMPFHDLVHSLLAHRMHRTDARGRPLYIQRTGHIDPVAFTQRIPIPVLILTHLHFQERVQQAMHAASVECGRRQSQVVNLIDCDGFTLGHARMVTTFRVTATADQLLYPETLASFVMLNAPSFMPYLWGLARPYLDARTQEKVRIVGRVGGAGVKGVVEELGWERVPKEYGGGCECEGGCVPRLEAHHRGDDEEVKGYEMEGGEGGGGGGGGGEEVVVVVGAGKVGEGGVQVEVGEGEEARVWWRVTVTSKDLSFHVQWLPEGGGAGGEGGQVTPLTQPRKVDAAAEGGGEVRGVMTLAERGRVRLVFDNSYSRFTSKEVRYRVGVRVTQVKLDEAQAELDAAEGGEAVNGVVEGVGGMQLSDGAGAAEEAVRT